MWKSQTACFGGGCFWCIEATFELVEGVLAVRSGYAAGRTKNPTYETICSGTTGHAEVVQVDYNPAQISYEELLRIFFLVHDPTTLNRQGNDVGTQYRSVILYASEEQKKSALDFIENLSKASDLKIITEVAPLETFYEAEAYHQSYYRRNQEQPYCQVVIDPKLNKLRKFLKERKSP